MNLRACLGSVLKRRSLCHTLVFALLVVGSFGLPAVVQAKAGHAPAAKHGTTEADLYNALKKVFYGSQKDRAAADALFRRVLRSDNIQPVSYVNYPVYGASEQEIEASQEHAKTQVGIGEWGYTYSKWSYHYGANQPVRLTLQTSITMPVWKSNGSSREAAPYFWGNFDKALLFHEQGHRLIGEYVVALMRLRLNAAGSAGAANAAAICNPLGDLLNNLNQQYDQVTSHGATQGATL